MQRSASTQQQSTQRPASVSGSAAESLPAQPSQPRQVAPAIAALSSGGPVSPPRLSATPAATAARLASSTPAAGGIAPLESRQAISPNSGANAATTRNTPRHGCNTRAAVATSVQLQALQPQEAAPPAPSVPAQRSLTELPPPTHLPGRGQSASGASLMSSPPTALVQSLPEGVAPTEDQQYQTPPQQQGTQPGASLGSLPDQVLPENAAADAFHSPAAEEAAEQFHSPEGSPRAIAAAADATAAAGTGTEERPRVVPEEVEASLGQAPRASNGRHLHHRCITAQFLTEPR